MSLLNVHANVANLNYEFLVQFRELYRQSPGEAGLRFHINAEAGKRVMDASHEELKALARTGRMVFALDIAEAQSAKPH